MSESIRAEGIWWLPGTTDTLSAGTLVYDGRRARLESVLGPIADRHPNTHFAPGPEVIHGRTHSGELYTCFRTFYSGTHVNETPSGGHLVARVDVLNILKGAHFDKSTDAAFKQARWLYSNLHIWLFEREGLQRRSTGDKEYTVKCTRGEIWRSEIGDGFVLENDYRFNSHFDFNPREENFSFADGIRILSDKPRPFAEFLPLERKFRALVNLLAECQLDVISGTYREDPDKPGVVELLGHRWTGGFATREDPVRGADPVPYTSIEDFSTVIAKWFSEYSRLEPVVNLYLFGKHNSFLDVGNTFLDLIQALEAFHRIFRPGTFMPEDEYKEKIRKPLYAAIPAETPDDLRDRLKSAIRYGHEFSLMRRLNDLVDMLPTHPLFDQVRDKKFRARTKDTRNTMTHQIPDPEHPPMEGAELYVAINRWREVLFSLILKTIDITDPVIVEAVRRLRAREGTFVAV